MAHEFYRQNNIDILFCGASHVSHGMDPRISDKEFGENIWQARYYDHIIRNQTDYNETYEYIENNPLNWILKQKETESN